MAPPDATVPRPRLEASPSSRNAVRGGVLAALSSPPAAAAQGAPTAPDAAIPIQPPAQPPARGLWALVRAAGRRGLRAARPLAAPFLHRFQMRVRTAINESDLAARTAGIEHALASLSGRLDEIGGDLAERVDVARRDLDASTSRRLGALGAALAERTDAARREVAGVGEAAAANARRLDALGAALAERTDAARREVAEIAVANTRRLEALEAAAADNAQRQEATLRRLDEIQQSVAALAQAVHAVAARRPPVPAGNDFLVHTPDGYLLVPSEDVPYLVYIMESGVPEPGTRRVLQELLRPGGAFLDVGANVGTLTLFAARAVGSGGRVFAVEPTPRLAALLGRSLAMNGVSDRVSVVACAAGEASGEATFHLEEIMSHNSLFPSAADPGAAAPGRTITVPVRPVDEVVPPGTALDVAKIDVEGAELLVWRGMRRVLAESPDLAAVLEFGPAHLARAGVSPEAWLEEVTAPGFEPFVIDEATGACRPASASALAEVSSVNVLLLRPGAAARHPSLVSA